MTRGLRVLGIMIAGTVAGYFAGRRVFPYEPYALINPGFIFGGFGAILGPMFYFVCMGIFGRIEHERDPDSRTLRMMYAVVSGSGTTFLAVLALAYWWKNG